MSTSRIISSSPITQAQVKTYAPALATIPESLAGRVRYLYELATGKAAIEADGIVTPLNPQGLAGIDRSGPPWGDALQHPLWVREGMAASSTVYGEKPIATFSASGDRARIIIRVNVPPSQGGPKSPYSLGELTIVGVRTGGASNATATITAYAGEEASGPTRTSTLTMTTLNALASTTVFVPLTQGLCRRLIAIESTASPAFSIVNMSLNQVVRRSH